MASPLASASIRDPEVAVGVDMNSVGPLEYPRAEAPEQVAVDVEEEDGIEIVVPHAGVLAAALGDPDVSVGGRVDGAGRAPGAALGQLAPDPVHRAIGIGRVVLGKGGRREGEGQGEQEQLFHRLISDGE